MMSDLPIAGDGGMPVPVYDCRVILSPPDANGKITARVASLPEITATGTVERDLLLRIVKDFKTVLIRYRERGEEIPWQDPPESLADGEQQRWIPVHL